MGVEKKMCLSIQLFSSCDAKRSIIALRSLTSKEKVGVSVLDSWDVVGWDRMGRDGLWSGGMGWDGMGWDRMG